MSRKSSPFSPRKSKGFTLIEMLIVLVIIIILASVAVAAVRGAMGKSDVASDLQGIASLQTATKSLRGAGGYGAAGTNLVPTLVAMDAVPKTLTLNGTNITNAWNGDVTVVSTGTGYSITSTGIPKDACIEEASKLSKGAMSTKVGSAAAVNGEVTTITATASCTADTNTIVWTSAN